MKSPALAFAGLLLLSLSPMPAQIRAESSAASAGVLGEHELAEIGQMPAQQQAERLLERSVTQYRGALEQIWKMLPSWEGQLSYSRKIQTLTELAYNSSELGIRTAAVEITLISNRIVRDPATARFYSDQLKSDPKYKPWRLWVLALLANRGVETESTKRLLLEYIQDPNQETRAGAVNALAMLGSDDIIEPLIRVLGTDPSSEVRERAGCGLAESGMLSREQRQKAIPGLMRLMDDPSLDRTTQTWVFQALREISGQDFGENRPAWRDWKAKRGL